MTKLVRVFPRKTNATPDDENVRFTGPGLFDEPEEVHVSVTWTWDIPKAEHLAHQWRMICDNVQVGGPAYGDPGGEFTPGLYLRNGYTITSRGCPNRCWFCTVHEREGSIRELPIHDGYILQDNNILACSRQHIEAVFAMLSRQKEPVRFSGGLEAKLLEPWHVEAISKMRLKSVWMAYDTSDDYGPLAAAAKMFKDAGVITPTKHFICCYVLIGWPRDTFEYAERRLTQVLELGIMPFAMLYNHGEGLKDKDEWIHFAKTWANRWAVATRLKKLQGV
jgi:hypothetical protein